MRTIDKIRKYISNNKGSAGFKAGDRLPSSREMMKMFGGSYATIRSALSKLEEEGLVDIANGAGTFIAGARELNIDIYCLTTTLEFELFSTLLNKYIKKHNLHINVHLKDVFNLIRHKETPNPDKDRKVIMVECAPEMNYNISGLYNFIGYEGHDKLRSSLLDTTTNDISAALPFYSFSSQLGINGQLLKRAGFPLGKITGDFDWWEEYVNACKAVGITPAACQWERDSKWPFKQLYNLLFALKINKSGSLDALYKRQKPYFDTSSGQRFLEIMQDCECLEHNNPNLFCRGGAGMNFMIGSWITVQNKNRVNINVDDLKILPYRFGDQRICNIQTNNLHSYLYSGISTEEKQRTWKLLKILLSKAFQKEFCSLSGTLSVRKDLKPEDYSWYSDEFAPFMPQKNDIVIHNSTFSRSMNAYLTALFEQYKFYGTDIKTILKCMDAKIQ